MEYLYETEHKSYEDFASGRVLHNARGTTSFPARLGSEIIQRCFRMLEDKGVHGPYTVYDPCCGGAHLLTVAGFMHGERIGRIWASDINAEALQIAASNLSLLTASGLQTRKEQLTRLLEQYGKPSHEEALASAGRLEQLLGKSRIEAAVAFQCDITSSPVPEGLARSAHIVATDLPYGDVVSWDGGSADPVADLFDGIYNALDPHGAIVAVIADKGQKLKHGKFNRIKLLKIGKRQIGFFEPMR